MLTLVLVLDDLLLLHEAAAFAPWAGALVAAAYGLAFLRFVVRFRDVILRDLDVGLLLLAVGSLGLSLVTDLLVAPTQSSVLVEDGAKLLGLVAWSAFVLRTALFALGHSGAQLRSCGLECRCEPGARTAAGRPPLGLPDAAREPGSRGIRSLSDRQTPPRSRRHPCGGSSGTSATPSGPRCPW